MDHLTNRSIARPASVLLALALALSMLMLTPGTARAHDACPVAEPAASGFLATVLSAANVFASLLQTDSAPCPSKFDEVDVKLTRDWGLDSATQAAAAGKGPKGKAPKTAAPCIQGMAADMFPCDGVDLLSHVSHSELGTTFVNDMWGWTDPATKKDYALVGSSEGTVFVDISDPKRPEVLGIMPTAVVDSRRFWRDIKVYEDHAFVVSENNGHGMQIFDLTRLRDWDGTYTVYMPDARYTGHGSAHNLNINTETGYAYVVGARGSSVCGTGLHMVDIGDPTAPAFAGCFDGHGYVHDTQCVVYRGPDAAYQGQEICFNSNGLSYGTSDNYLSIVDVTDKANPVPVSRTWYEGANYSHQGWLTEDQSFFLHGDEGDEFIADDLTTTRVWDVRDLDAPSVRQVFRPGTTSIDHNIYTQGRYAYAANYTTGLRVHDLKDLESDGLEEAAYFDTYPENDNASFEGGAWSNYPYFRQKGLVAVSSIDRGLFVLQPRVGRNGG